MAIFTGTAGNDNQAGTNSDDSFDYSQGGKDTLSGKNGNDTFTMGAELDVKDKIDGGSGTDTVILNGAYTLTLGAATIVNVEILQLTAGSDYTLTLDNANTTLGQGLRIDASALGAGDDFTFDGSTETSSALDIRIGAGKDNVFAGGGDDVIRAGANLVVTDTINGGAGRDRLILDGDYFSSPFNLNATTLRSIEKITVTASNSYVLGLHNAMLDFGEALTVDGGSLGASDILTVSASAITVGRVQFIGGAGTDSFGLGQSGEDVARLGGGDDSVSAGANMTDSVKLSGGGGTDELSLVGDYSDELQFLANTVRSFETFVLGGLGFDYNIATADRTVAAGATLTVDATSASSASQEITFDGSAESNGAFDFIAGAAGETFIAGAGDDIFHMAADFGNDDSLDGGAGFDTLYLDGDYGTVFDHFFITEEMLSGVEYFVFAAGHDYFVDLADGSPFELIDGSALGASDSLTLLCQSETGLIIGGSGDDFLQGASITDISLGGNDTVLGNGVYAGAELTAADSISASTIDLNGDYTAGNALVLGSSTVTGASGHIFTVAPGHDYDLTMHEDTTLLVSSVDGSMLGAGDILEFDATADTDAAYVVDGGAANDILRGGNGLSIFHGGGGNDQLFGGSGDDQFYGDAGGDTLDTGSGSDLFIYSFVSDSTGPDYDTIVGADFSGADQFAIFVPTAFNTAVTTGTLSTASFNSDLAAAIGAGQLGFNNAVLFTPNAGTLSGRTFLIVDTNSTAGYQAGADVVFDVTGFTGTLDTSDFI